MFRALRTLRIFTTWRNWECSCEHDVCEWCRY